MRTKARYTFEIDKNTQDFVKKIEYVIGAIKNDIATATSSWKIRHEELRIQTFESLIQRTIEKQVMSSLPINTF